MTVTLWLVLLVSVGMIGFVLGCLACEQRWVTKTDQIVKQWQDTANDLLKENRKLRQEHADIRAKANEIRDKAIAIARYAYVEDKL